MTGCVGGQLTGDWLLLHATSRCPYITHLDTSWTNVDTAGVTAAADNCQRSTTPAYLLNYSLANTLSLNGSVCVCVHGFICICEENCFFKVFFG